MNVFKLLEAFIQRPQQSGNPLESFYQKTLNLEGKPKISHTVDPFPGLSIENRVIRLKEENKFAKV